MHIYIPVALVGTAAVMATPLHFAGKNFYPLYPLPLPHTHTHTHPSHTSPLHTMVLTAWCLDWILLIVCAGMTLGGWRHLRISWTGLFSHLLHCQTTSRANGNYWRLENSHAAVELFYHAKRKPYSRSMIIMWQAWMVVLLSCIRSMRSVSKAWSRFRSILPTKDQFVSFCLFKK